jgi:hypothetical protein
MKGGTTIAVAVQARKGAARLFWLTGTVPYVRKDGTATTLAVWTGRCRECGETFTVATRMPSLIDGCIASKAFDRVHCDHHKRQPKRRGA